MATKQVKAKSSAELLSYIINETPILRDNIDLPVQGQNIQEIGRIIIDNERYRNAFINTVNLIGVTMIKNNEWEDPWDFTDRGMLRYGQQVREIINDLVKAYDYNTKLADESDFIKTEVPNVLQYIHSINFQKYYKTTTSDAQVSMAFDSETSLYDFITNCISMLYQSYIYDKYIINKYMLCRRLLDGSVTSYQITDIENKTTRQIVSEMKAVSNKMAFRSPNYNPAGLRRATKFEDQIMIMSTDFDAKVTTEVLATSFFRNDAEMKTRLALIDGFGNHDTERLTEVLGDAYVPFTEDELTALSAVSNVIISRDWFMDYYYAIDNAQETKQTSFYNPQTLKENIFLHVWRIFSTSPFENACAFQTNAIAVKNVTVNPSKATVTQGQGIQLNAVVETTGFANKAVTWSVDNTSAEAGVKISDSGYLSVPASGATGTITVTAKSVYDNIKTGTATITIATVSAG